MAVFMAVGADDGHLSERAVFDVKKNQRRSCSYAWPARRPGCWVAWKSSRWPPSGWRVRCSLMPAAMLEIHDAALRVLWGLLEANPLLTPVKTNGDALQPPCKLRQKGT